MEVVNVTGFGSGLYFGDELDSNNVKEKEQKIQFLEKIINVVGMQLNTIVEAKPGKIVAGLDPQDTNRFLQLFAIAAKYMPDSSAAVRTVLEQMGGGGAPAMSAPDPVAAPTRDDSDQRRSAPKERSNSANRESEEKAEEKNPPKFAPVEERPRPKQVCLHV